MRTLRTRRSLTPRGSKSPISFQSERSTSVREVSSRNAPEAVARGAGDLQRRPHRVVLEVDEDDDVHVGRGRLGELRRGEHRVPAVGGDERVRNGADARPPHQEACASVETPIAPATWAA